MKTKSHTLKSHKRLKNFLFLLTGALLLIAIGFVIYLVRHTILAANQPCANSISCVSDLSGTYQPFKDGIFMGHKVAAVPKDAFPETLPRVLGDATSPKHIYVDLTTQRLKAYQGNVLLFDFPVSTGKWRITPDGDFRIWVKLRYAHMEGGDQTDGTYYNLYNIPYTMFFGSDTVPDSLGFSIHGAYWHDNFGHPMSHGCVNMRPEDAAKIYAWADPATVGDQTNATESNPGTLVTITGQTPDE